MNMKIATTIKDVITWAKETMSDDEEKLSIISVYGDSVVSNKHDLELSDVCYIDANPEEGANEEDVFSNFVNSNNLKLLFSGHILADTIANMIGQKSNATDDEFLEALTYYLHNDGFIQIDTARNSKDYFCVLVPSVQIDALTSFIHEFGEQRLREYSIYNFEGGSMIATSNVRSDYLPFAHAVSQKYSYAINITVTAEKWSHVLYADFAIASPAPCVASGKGTKKKVSRKSAPAPEAIKEAFPSTDVTTLRNYVCKDKDETTLIEKNGQLYVRAEDRYSIDEPKQGFDFIRYLGFDIHF